MKITNLRICELANLRILLPAILLATTPLAAQQTASGNGCSKAEAVGYLGISGIDCDCTVSTPGSGHEWNFRTEPKITSLEMDSRAGSLLRPGDVITAVNGKLITTRDGARELAELKPGQNITLTIRRDGATRYVSLTAESTCPDDSRNFSIYAPGQRSYALVPGRGYSTAPTPAPGVAPSARAWTAVTATPGVAYEWAEPRATFGMGLSCSNCTMGFSERERSAYMSFSRPPEVYSIERNGPAEKAGIRRGDVITHVNGKEIDSDEGGKIFGSAKPGQVVKFTVVRKNQRHTYTVRAAERTPRPALAQTRGSLDRARLQLEQMEKSQADQLRRLVEQQRKQSTETQRELSEQHREMIREEQEHVRQIQRLAAEMDRAAKAASTASCAVPMLAPTASTRSTRTLRYTGALGGTEIEVRGAPASVTETADEIVITTGGSVVRVSKKK